MELGIIEAFVRQRMAHDKTGHDIQHLERVVANARQSINTVGLDGVLYFLGFKDSYLQE